MPTYSIKTFGCQMNKSDSQRLATVIEKEANYKPAPLREADLVIFNTCSVRQTAEDRAFGQIREAKKRGQKVVLTGCLKNQASFLKKNPEIDITIDINNISNLPTMIQNKKTHECSHGKCTGCSNKKDYFSIKPKIENQAQVYVPIMTGCDNFCTYCIVPYVRGRERSRNSSEIIKEIKEHVKNGAKQITLLGQNVNSYISKEDGKAIVFTDILEQVADIPGDFRVFFVTSHPKDFTDKIIELVKKYDKLCPYFHLPIQSGSDRVLKVMNRKYDQKRYLSIIAKIKKDIPEASISTDIIVGFPGESKEDFEETKKICEQGDYDQAYIARFSPRPMTAAAKMKDDVTPEEKKNREKILTEIVTTSALQKNENSIGQTCQVLVESSHEEDGKHLNFGKNEYFKTVKFESSKNLKDEMIDVEITKAMSWGLFGKIKNESKLNS